MHHQAQILRETFITTAQSQGAVAVAANEETEQGLRQFFAEVWDQVLVPLAGAHPSANERFSFVHHQMDTDFPASEYRFQGRLGFGGKFRVRTDEPTQIRFVVDCYKEDQTPDTLNMIGRTNAALLALRDRTFRPHAQTDA